MKMAVSNYENGKTSKKEFLTQLNNVATTSGSEGPKGGLIVWNPAYRKYVGLPPIGQDPKRFRLPSLDEIRNENAWQSYLKERQKFNRSERLFHSTKTLLALSQELTKDHSEMEISEINKSILQVKESIKVLAEE